MLFAASNRQGSTAETVFSEARSRGIIAGKEGREESYNTTPKDRGQVDTKGH
jgi:hypothetical protein